MCALLDLSVQIDRGQILQLLRVATEQLAIVIQIRILISVGVDAKDVEQATRVQIMLDAVANEH